LTNRINTVPRQVVEEVKEEKKTGYDEVSSDEFSEPDFD
jgi:hypothetical protein